MEVQRSVTQHRTLHKQEAEQFAHSANLWGTIAAHVISEARSTGSFSQEPQRDSNYLTVQKALLLFSGLWGR